MCFPSAPSAPDPNKQAQRAATEATARANAQLVADQRRRRGQSNLLAGGAEQETLGAGAANPAGARMAANVLGGGAVLYDSVTGRSRSGGSPGTPGGGGSRSGTRMAV